MKIEIKNHARERMKLYGITEEQVVSAIESPDLIVKGKNGRKIAQKRLNSYMLRVIYEEIRDKLEVITVYKAKRERYEV